MPVPCLEKVRLKRLKSYFLNVEPLARPKSCAASAAVIPVVFVTGWYDSQAGFLLCPRSAIWESARMAAAQIRQERGRDGARLHSAINTRRQLSGHNCPTCCPWSLAAASQRTPSGSQPTAPQRCRCRGQRILPFSSRSLGLTVNSNAVTRYPRSHDAVLEPLPGDSLVAG